MQIVWNFSCSEFVWNRNAKSNGLENCNEIICNRINDYNRNLTEEYDCMNKKKIIVAVICAVVLWVAVGIIDYGRVHSFEKPIFCVGTELADEGGSGKYVGLGYSFDIEGNIMQYSSCTILLNG